MKNAVIFGGTGFIGTFFAIHLINNEKYQKVYLYDHETIKEKDSIYRNKLISGNNNIINSGALIEHEATIGNSNHIAPKSIIGGRVKIGNNVLIGLGSKILPGIKICSDVIIGAGAVVTKNINKPQTYIGIPAKVVKKKALKSKKKNIK